MKRCYRLVALLLEGDWLDRRKISAHLEISLANADRHMRVARATLSLEERAGKAGLTSIRMPTRARRVSKRAAVAGCIGASLAPLLEGTPFEQLLHNLAIEAAAATNDSSQYEHYKRQFLFVARGGERALRRDKKAVLDTVIDAIVDKCLLRVSRQKFDGTTETLVIKPVSLALHEHQFYVLGFRDGEIQNIRFSRIIAALKLKDTFEYPTLDAYDPRAVFRHSLGIFIRDEPENGISVEKVTLRLHRRWTSYVATHRWHESQTHKSSEDGLILTLVVRTCPDLERLILGFGAEAEVLTPLHLRERIANMIRATAALYGTAPGSPSPAGRTPRRRGSSRGRSVRRQ